MAPRPFRFNPFIPSRFLEEDFERIRQKHEDSSFGMDLLDELELDNETFPFEEED